MLSVGSVATMEMVMKKNDNDDDDEVNWNLR